MKESKSSGGNSFILELIFGTLDGEEYLKLKRILEEIEKLFDERQLPP
ncbi:hypothetical protein [Thermococcus sp. GR6]|nr:hypothetical protein [Thermococcus sp. GR6]